MKRYLGGLVLAAGVVCLLTGTVRREEQAQAAGLEAARTWGVWVFLDPDSARSELPPPHGADVRARRPLLDTDHPVEPALVERVASTGARVRVVSRWLRAVAVDADSVTLARLAAMPAVIRIEPIASSVLAGAPARGPARTTATDFAPRYPFRRHEPFAAPRTQPGDALRAHVGDALPGHAQDSAFYGPNYAALRELNLPVLHALGFTGTGVRIAIFDTGFLLGHETLASRFVPNQFDFISNRPTVGDQPGEAFLQSRHGTAIMSLLGGHAPGRFVGGAWGAQFLLAKMKLGGDFDVIADEDRWVAAAEWADVNNARLINSSIGFRARFANRDPIPYGALDGNTTVTTRMADEAARRGILVIVAMGNMGPAAGSLWAPADADSVISVGAVDSLLPNRLAVPAIVSSRGPTADGRTKPELSARGVRIVAAAVQSLTAYEGNLTGSSYATPLITAGAALFMEAWPNLSIMAVRQALMLAGSSANAPNNVVGFGVPDVAAAIMFPEGIVLGPSSLSTRDLQGNLTTIMPTFRWETPQTHPRMRPITYVVQVARDSLFQLVLFSDTVTEANIYTARRPLQPIDRAWWRVVAISHAGVQRTSPPQPAFRVPPWVRLLSPNESEPVFLDDPRPELNWAPLAAPAPLGPFVYDVQILSVATGQIVQQMRNLTTSSVRVPDPLVPNQSYRWRVIARTQATPASPAMADTVQSLAPFVITSAEAPPATILYQNFPNPFPNPGAGGGSGTRVWFDLAQDGVVELAVYDLRGRLIRQLIPGRGDCGAVSLRAGLYGRVGGPINGYDEACVLTTWDGRDARGALVSRGVYVLRLRAGGVSDVRRMLFMPD